MAGSTVLSPFGIVAGSLRDEGYGVARSSALGVSACLVVVDPESPRMYRIGEKRDGLTVSVWSDRGVGAGWVRLAAGCSPGSAVREVLANDRGI